MRRAWLLPCLFFVPAAPGAPPFSLQAEKTAFFLGEPVYLMIRSAQAGKPPALEEDLYTLFILAPEGGDSAYQPPMRLRAGPAAEPAGAPVPRWARLIASAGGGLVFPRAGNYGLELRKPTPDTQALSNRLAIEVRMPATRDDRRAYAILSRNPGEYALAVYLEGGDQLRDGMAIIRELSAFPNAYRATARFVLCSDWSQDFKDFASGKTRKADLPKALEYAQWQPADRYIALRSAYRIQRALAAAPAVSADGDTAAVPGRRQAEVRLHRFLAALSPAALSAYQAF